MNPYTLATWRARLITVFLLVLLPAGTALVAQTAQPAQPVGPAVGKMQMGEMKQACAAKHEASAKDVEALTKTVTTALASIDPAVLRAALEATHRHLEGMQAKAAKCAAMMNAPAAATAPAPTQQPDDPAHKH